MVLGFSFNVPLPRCAFFVLRGRQQLHRGRSDDVAFTPVYGLFCPTGLTAPGRCIPTTTHQRTHAMRPYKL